MKIFQIIAFVSSEDTKIFTSQRVFKVKNTSHFVENKIYTIKSKAFLAGTDIVCCKIR